MNKDTILIRKIKPEDNTQIEAVIRACFHEFKIPLVGTAYTDSETPQMYQAYQCKREVYYVLVVNGMVLGGGGIKPLKDYEKHVCEIQKMYFSPQIRGKGYGKLMFDKCLQTAKRFKYKQCYLESAPQLKSAIHIYENYGFKHLELALGNTGHHACGVWMIKNI